MIKMKQVELSSTTSLILSGLIKRYFNGNPDDCISTLIVTHLIYLCLPVDFLTEIGEITHDTVQAEVVRLFNEGQELLKGVETQGGMH